MNQSERKRAKILSVTRQLLQERRINDITMDEIAEKAEVSKVTIFKYFDSKNNLMNLVIMKALRRVMTGVQRILETDDDFETTYRQISALKLQQITHFTPAFTANLMQKYSEDPTFFDLDSRAMQQQMYQKLFAKGRAEGKIDPRFTDEFLQLFLDVINEGLKAIPLERLLPYNDSFTEAFIQAFKK